MKSTKYAFIGSFIALALCVTLLCGATYAWFTSTASSPNNVIRTGTYSVEVTYYNGAEWASMDGVTLFNNADVLPGNTATRYIKVSNANAYPVHVDVKTAVEGTGTADVTFYAVPVTSETAAPDLSGLTGTASNDSANATLLAQDLAANGSVIIALVVAVDENAATPDQTVTFTVNVLTTQQVTNP